MKTIPLEDTYADTLNKAKRGYGLDISDLAAQAGISADAAEKVLDGEFDEAAARALAKPLKLQPDAVVALGQGTYVAEPIPSFDGFAQFNTAFEDMTVNSYLVWDSAAKVAVAFDTGADCDGMLDLLAGQGLKLELILLTHTHADHIFDLDRLHEKTGAAMWTGEKEPVEGVQPFAPGKSFQVGSLKIASRSTWGHCQGGITYVVTGLAHDLAIVGDAIFAGSMGGGGISYEAAIKTNHESIFSLPDQTIVCPGHGPLTTVGEQKRANPFFQGN